MSTCLRKEGKGRDGKRREGKGREVRREEKERDVVKNNNLELPQL